MIYLAKYKNVAIFVSKRSFLTNFLLFFNFSRSNLQSLLFVLNTFIFPPSYHFWPQLLLLLASPLNLYGNFSKTILQNFFSNLKFLQKLSHKNAIKTEIRVKIHWKRGHIVAIFEKILGHIGHDFQCHWPYLVSKSWEHCFGVQTP